MARGFDRMPKIRRAEKRAHFFGGNEFAKFQPMRRDQIGVLSGRNDSHAMASRTQRNAEADERQDVAIGSERNENRVHSLFDRTLTDLFRRTFPKLPRVI